MSFASVRGRQIWKLLRNQRIKRNTACLTDCNQRSFHIRKGPTLLNELSKQWRICRFYSDLPSHIKVPLPALSPTMEMGTIVSWAKKEGDRLNEGDLLAEIETDKATMGFETPEEGYLAKILVPAGSRDVPIGKHVCIITENEGDIIKFKDYKDDGSQTTKAKVPPSPPPPPPAPTPTPTTSPAQTTKHVKEAVSLTEKGRIYASPMAKRLAEKKNIRLEEVEKKSGLFGSVKSKDLALLKPSRAPTSSSGTPFVDIPVSNIRAVISKRLVQSKQSIPHYYLAMECCMDEILKLRSNLNTALEKEKIKLSVNDFVIKATALASKKVPEANSSWMDTVIRQYNVVDVSVAVSTSRGLITPIVFHADTKGLIEISNNVKQLAQKAREGKLQPHEFQGGTISVSNLGMFGTQQFCAIINPPQACILAVGTTFEKFVPVKGQPVVQNFMMVTLGADHRVVDGAVGAQWLKEFKTLIEQPHHMLL